MKLRIYTDGACSGNPGIGGWGVYFETINVKLYGGKPQTTNNEMELTAIYEAIDNYEKYWDGLLDELVICSDSAYCVNIFNCWIKGWIERGVINEKKNSELIMKIYNRIKSLPIKVSFEKVAGHSGIQGNEIADELARKGIADMIYVKKEDNTETLIVYIATGKYLQYLQGFFETLDNFETPGKFVEVFTDQNLESTKFVNVNHIDYQYWPITVLNKFRYILYAMKKHPNAKQVWYFDSKIEFRGRFKPLDTDKLQVFPHTSWGNVLSSVNGDVEEAFKKYHWNRTLNEKSECYFNFGEKSLPYIQSAAFGGNKHEMFVMCAFVNEWIMRDLMHNIIPMWHDESYLNGYAQKFPMKVKFFPKGIMGEKDNPKCDNPDAPVNFRNTDLIQQEKQRIYDS